MRPCYFPMNYFLSKANILYSIKIENLSAWMEKYSKPENREKETTDPVCQINVECAAKYATGRRKLESWDLVCRFLSFLRSARLFQRCSPPTLMPTNAHNAKTRLASIFFIKQISNKFK